MIVFSKIRCTANTTSEVAEGLVGGSPIQYSDLQGWTCFEEFLDKLTKPSRVLVEVKTYGYGEDDGYGKFNATPEEVAYMMQRIDMRPDFLETRCTKLRQHKVDIDWDPEELFPYVGL